ncbi:MAG: putative ATPase [Gammaproteobacteria bacterium]|jgi:predicted AAA+ superfamily ATPase|nr:putative ATPase [Gammaproteobacteria bacterium]
MANIYKRQLDLLNLLKKKSFFLLGPRATGKSYLIDQQLASQAIILDLLRSELYLRLSAGPWELEQIIDAQLSPQKNIIVIDEIQKIPELLDEVHRLIEKRKLCFLLTGSSARKLKRGHANLLAGRAWTAALYPLSFSEIPHFNLDHYLRFGGLPTVYASDNSIEELNAYVQSYLREEIQAEGLVRKLPPFSRFLTTAAFMNGQLLNFTQLASDTAVPASTIREYYSILEDTLVGFSLLPWTQSKKRKAIATAKFYFFDTGVAHTLAQTQVLDRNSDLYGRSFEHWIGMELRSYLSYRRRSESLSFWRSTRQHEVDFVVGDHTAIETKATRKVTARDMKGLEAIEEENIFKQLILISQDPIEKKYGKILCLHWKTFITRLWGDELL